MEHEMNLAAEPFKLIASGKKTIELRLYDEKRQKIKVGDKIKFTNTENSATLFAEVLALYLFENFEELYRSLPLSDCGYTEERLKSASHKDMEAYYTPERQKLYGVVGIKIKLIK